MMDVIQEIERQLLMVLLENIPEQKARDQNARTKSLLNGPQVDTFESWRRWPVRIRWTTR